jgi:hypothetical protein
LEDGFAVFELRLNLFDVDEEIIRMENKAKAQETIKGIR